MRRLRYAVSLVAIPGALFLAGCGSTSGVVYGGQSRSAPPIPEPLWSVGPISRPSGNSLPPPSPSERPEPVPDITLPAAADASALDPRTVVAKDPGMTEDSRQSAARCPSGCGLRTPVLRDVTGDGRRELILLIDPDRRSAKDYPEGLQTELYVYRVDGGHVYQVLGRGVQEDSRIDLQGRDLIVRQTLAGGAKGGLDQVTTDRYQWDSGRGYMEMISTVTGPVPSTGKKP
ncbi:hypothetical protein [Streptomyces sp. HUAS TT7]|uniref:hypothetical protein n=1 Tax=Streptomyces sp. HUAS TT7 TaxID=3447507 RepID=UPI003F6588C8